MDRLSPYNIKNHIYRQRLYKDIRSGDPDWDTWEVSVDELHRPDLISYRYYGTDKAKLIVVIASKMKDIRGEIEAGINFSLPPLKWIRARIRYYEAMENKILENFPASED